MHIKDFSGHFAAIAKILASIVTIFGVIIAILTYRNSVAIKRVEIVNNLYNEFETKETDTFYAKIEDNDTLSINNKSENERQLEKILTIFDKVHNYYDQGIVDDKTLSYIACEILDFYNHKSVQKFIKKCNDECDSAGYSEKIRPFSGFTKLGEYLSKKYIKQEKQTIQKEKIR